MNTLAEIEAGVPNLNIEELDRLESRLRELRHRRVGEPSRPPTDLAQFSGILRVAEDPLDWQRRIRREWE